MRKYGLKDAIHILTGKKSSEKKPLGDCVTESSKVQKGDLFFALKGKKVDAHKFLKEVAERGAAAAVVSQEYQGESYGLTLIRVPDVLDGLQHLAKTVLEERGTRVVAVTGSVGKTTTKEFLAHLLSAKFRVAKSPGNANSQVGVPCSIMNSDGDEELLVLEMGISEPGEMHKLIAIAPPEVTLITKIALAHVGFFENGIEGIAAEKCAIMSHPRTQMGILHSHARGFEAALKSSSCEKLFFGRDEEADYRLFPSSNKLIIEEKGTKSPAFTLPFNAAHLEENFIGAAAVARHLGLSWEQIFNAALTLQLFPMRFERIERDGVVFINDTYNSNPESLRAAL